MSRPASHPLPAHPSSYQWAGLSLLLILAMLLASSFWQTCLSSRILATNFVSPASWLWLTGGHPVAATMPDQVTVSYGSILIVVAGVMGLIGLTGTLGLIRGSRRGIASNALAWGTAIGLWCCLLDLWEWAWIVASMIGWESLTVVLTLTPQLWLAFCLTGLAASFWGLAFRARDPVLETVVNGRQAGRWVATACLIYIVVFTTMNWRLYFNLLIPHGDSAMYEEHLWNILHGKGFRSYLDQGLFWGEHIQFVHLFLIPVYLLWPSHLLLELSESTALALGAFPVFWMTARQTKSEWAGFGAAMAYLLYTPMQFLDIEIDLKTFRPEAFGIPLLLLTLDQLERCHLRGFLVGMALTLTVKEDYAIVFGPLGLWVAWREYQRFRTARITTELHPAEETHASSGFRRGWAITGVVVTIASVIYLWLATRIIMPWFRSGVEIHYAGYFKKFGTTPEQIVFNMVTNPALLLGELVTPETTLYALAMLAPVAFLPFFSPGRLLVGAPLFGILCLNSLARDPRHHFHAPLVAIVFWSVAGGLPMALRCLQSLKMRWQKTLPISNESAAILLRKILMTSSLTTGLFVTLSPFGVPFWDPGSPWNWRRLYVPSERAEKFALVPGLIPQSSRVASTDFVHPRFTHYERSYDYSNYSRKVSNFERRVPDDTDYIVIDTRHHYSTIRRP